MTTNRPYTFDYHGTPVTVPAGTSVTHQTASGPDPAYYFVASFDWIDRDYPSINKVLRHDATYYGINVPVEYVTSY